MGLALPTATLIALLEKADSGDWPELEALQVSQPRVAPLHPQLLPPVLRDYVFDVSHRMQCPPDFVAVGVVVMLGALIGSRCAIKPKQRDSWCEYPNVWGGVIAPPGSLKSPAVSEALSPLSLLEKTARADYEKALLDHDVGDACRKFELDQTKKRIQRSKTSPTPQDRDELARLSRVADPPTLRRYRTNDATPEKLAEICAQNPRGILVNRDELVGLLESCGRDGREGERAFYLEGWNGGGRFTQDRIGRGHIHVERLCLSLFGGIQPIRLREYMYGVGGLQNDGLLQRFQLLCYPDPLPDYKVVDELPDAEAKQTIERLAQSIANADFAALTGIPKNAPGNATPHCRFERLVQHRFDTFLRRLDAKVRSEESPYIAEHLSKYRKLVPALALIFHVVDLSLREAGGSRISEIHLRRAMSWATYLEKHARRVYALAGDSRLDAAAVLQRKIKQLGIGPVFSERDLHRKSWRHLTSLEDVKGACSELVAAGWLRRQRSQGKKSGRPSSPAYEVNPKVFENA